MPLETDHADFANPADYMIIVNMTDCLGQTVCIPRSTISILGLTNLKTSGINKPVSENEPLFEKTGQNKPRWILHLATRKKPCTPTDLEMLENSLSALATRLEKQEKSQTLFFPINSQNIDAAWRDLLPVFQICLGKKSLHHHTFRIEWI